MFLLSICFMVSRATPTIMMIDVPPKVRLTGVNAESKVGMQQMVAKDRPPIQQSLCMILKRYFFVSTPGLIPGMDPPLAARLSAISSVLNTIFV